MLTTWHLLSAQVGNTLPRSGGRSVGIVRSQTQTMEFFFFYDIVMALCSGSIISAVRSEEGYTDSKVIA
jgi:hypothetical protein